MSRLALPAGTRIAEYEIVAPIARGAMGDVYRAWQGSLGRVVALKVLPPGWATDSEAEARFRRELTIQTRVTHANLVTVYDGGVEQGTAYLAMELVDGPSLTGWSPPDPFPAERFVELARPIAEALRYLHSRGVLHRDLKPGNILRTADGRIKVGDFGLSRSFDMTMITEQERAVGTPAYMPPEVIEGEAWSAAGDLYGLGMVYYHLLAARLPYRRELEGIEYLQEVLAARVVPVSSCCKIPHPEVERLVMGLLHRQAARRPSLSQVLDVLEKAASAPMLPATPEPVSRSVSGRVPVTAPVLGLLFLGGIAAGLILVVPRGSRVEPSASPVIAGSPIPEMPRWAAHGLKLLEMAENLRGQGKADLDMTLTRLDGKGTGPDPTQRARIFFELTSAVRAADEDGLTGPEWLLLESVSHDLFKELYRQSLYTIPTEDHASRALLAELERGLDDPYRRCLVTSLRPYLKNDPTLNQERARYEAYRSCIVLLEGAPHPTYDVLVRFRLFIHHREQIKVMLARQQVHGLLGNEVNPGRLIDECRRLIERGRDLAAKLAAWQARGLPPEPDSVAIQLMIAGEEVAGDMGEKDPDLGRLALRLVDEGWAVRVTLDPDRAGLPAARVIRPATAAAARRLDFAFRHLR